MKRKYWFITLGSLIVLVGIITTIVLTMNNRKFTVKYYVNDTLEYNEKSKTADLRHGYDGYTETDIRQNNKFIYPWYTNKDYKQARYMDLWIPYVPDEYHYQLNYLNYSYKLKKNYKLYTETTSLENLMYLDINSSISDPYIYHDQIDILFNNDENQKYYMVGYEKDKLEIKNEKSYQILYDFRNSVGRSHGTVHTVFGYGNYDQQVTFAARGLQDYDVFGTHEFDVAYTIDFDYDRFDDNITNFRYNDEYVTDELFAIYKKILKQNIEQYHTRAKTIANFLVSAGLSYYKEMPDLSKC